jgi:16S rRNA (cytosine1402-N4)-methyltransferase
MSARPDDPNRRRAVHQPVLLRETLAELDLEPGLTVVDGTVGAGGHSRKILEQIGPAGRLLGLDRDEMMLELAAQHLDDERATLVQSSYADLDRVLAERKLSGVDRILIDLGLSSDQLAHESRGFGFQTSGELDMRFDRSRGQPASELLNGRSAAELAEIFERLGEERYAASIAEQIVRRRSTHPFKTVNDLTEAVAAAIPRREQQASRKHPATRVFQALRIAVNDELLHLERALSDTFPRCLNEGGRLAAITFHSLEDRMVKTAFQDDQTWEILTPKPIVARPNEQKLNPRSRSAKLRAARRRATNPPN